MPLIVLVVATINIINVLTTAAFFTRTVRRIAVPVPTVLTPTDRVFHHASGAWGPADAVTKPNVRTSREESMRNASQEIRAQAVSVLMQTAQSMGAVVIIGLFKSILAVATHSSA